jgi:hypothetical protein
LDYLKELMEKTEKTVRMEQTELMVLMEKTEKQVIYILNTLMMEVQLLQAIMEKIQALELEYM